MMSTNTDMDNHTVCDIKEQLEAEALSAYRTLPITPASVMYVHNESTQNWLKSC